MAKSHFKEDQWWVSPYNYIPEVRDQLNLPPRVQIHDATLRDGEHRQTARVKATEFHQHNHSWHTHVPAAAPLPTTRK